jgi:hypothetical protein
MLLSLVVFQQTLNINSVQISLFNLIFFIWKCSNKTHVLLILTFTLFRYLFIHVHVGRIMSVI